jgi:hypothetical protein
MKKRRGGVQKEIGAPASGIIRMANPDAPGQRSQTRYLDSCYTATTTANLSLSDGDCKAPPSRENHDTLASTF